MQLLARERALALLLGPDGFDLGCGECFSRLDRYVELDLARADAARAIPGMRAHLECCMACEEEYRSLLDLVDRGALVPPCSPSHGARPRRRP